MQRAGQIHCTRADEYGLVEKMDLLGGRVEAHRDGFGFVLQEGGDDIYLSANEMRRVFHGDEVLVSVVGENRRGQPEGKLVEIIARNTTRVVGRLKSEAGVFFVVPDNPRITHDILVDKNDCQRAQPGAPTLSALSDSGSSRPPRMPSGGGEPRRGPGQAAAVNKCMNG